MSEAWKEAQAAALDEQAAALGRTLEELDVAEAILEQRRTGGLLVELRGVAAGLRSEVSSMTSEARALRARGAVDGQLALTVHHQRRRPLVAAPDIEQEEEQDG